MRSYSIMMDDGRCVASAPSNTYPDMATAIRDTARTALLLATDDRDGTIHTDPVECEIMDNRTREVRRFSVAVAATFHDP